tara:strand:- start:184 stop:702 length:519 start_codon:yes stop_codon:yes gene_type:complete
LEIDSLARSLRPQPLEEKSFKEFGDIIGTSEREALTINDGNTERFNDLADLAIFREGGKPSINIFRSKPISLPFVIKSMERHPLSSQAFFPLSVEPYLVVVAPKGELLPMEAMAFLAQPGQGVNFHPGVWHHYNLALNNISDFLVVDMIGETPNCDEITLGQQDQIQLVKPQ